MAVEKMIRKDKYDKVFEEKFYNEMVKLIGLLGDKRLEHFQYLKKKYWAYVENKHRNSWQRTAMSCNIPEEYVSKAKYYNKKIALEAIYGYIRDDRPLNSNILMKYDPQLYSAVRKYFGAFDNLYTHLNRKNLKYAKNKYSYRRRAAYKTYNYNKEETKLGLYFERLVKNACYVYDESKDEFSKKCGVRLEFVRNLQDGVRLSKHKDELPWSHCVRYY